MYVLNFAACKNKPKLGRYSCGLCGTLFPFVLESRKAKQRGDIADVYETIQKL